MKKFFLVILALSIAFSCFSYPAFVRKSGDKKVRDVFYSAIQQAFGFSKAECRLIRARGYAPQFALVLLFIAKEAGRPVAELAGLRDKEGLSAADMCEKYGIDHSALMDRLKAAVIQNNITIPPADSAEMKKSITTVPKKGGK
jgi:hypothetical protein